MSFQDKSLDSNYRRNKDERLYTDDSTFQFRVNSDLKDQFIQLCRDEQYTAARALKRYMLRCIQNGYVTHDFRAVKEKGGFDPW